ncbi:MAG: hypothetical protein ACE366_28745 [Bradymonadia bacterium]
MLWRIIKWFFILVGILALLTVGFVYWQLRTLKEAMRQDQPLAIAAVEAPPDARQALVQKAMEEAASSEHVIKLSGEHLTWILSAVIRRPEVRQAIEQNGAQISSQVQDLPVGDFEHFRIENFDLDRLKVKVSIEGDVLTLAGTMPYRNDDSHLNLSMSAAGSWQAGAGQLDPRTLVIGDEDLLDGMLTGGTLRTAIEEAAEQGFASIPPHQAAASPVERVEVKDGLLQLTMKPGTTQKVGLVMSRLLGGM